MDKSHLLTANLPVISAVFCVTFFSHWLSGKKQRHVLDWSLSCACGALGFSIGFTRLFLIDTTWLALLGNALLVGMAYFAARGVIYRHSGRSLDYILLPIYGTTIVIGLWFGYVDPSVIARGTASSLGASAIFVITVWVMLKANNVDRLDYLTMAAFIVTAVMLIARQAYVYRVVGHVGGEAEIAGSWWGFSFRILSTLSWISITILFFHRITTDLLKDLTAKSHTDLLTGIPNRRGFFSRAENTVTDGTIAVILCDIDEFKKVNDTYGHMVGDTVLQDFAHVLRNAAEPAGCIIGRLGGEEFVGLLPITNVVTARTFAESIRVVFASAIHQGVPSSHAVTVSIGIAIASRNEILEKVLIQADAALYRAKLKGRNCVEIDTMTHRAQRCGVQGRAQSGISIF